MVRDVVNATFRHIDAIRRHNLGIISLEQLVDFCFIAVKYPGFANALESRFQTALRLKEIAG